MGKHWKQYEDDILLKYYPYEGLDVAKRLEGRTARLCQVRAKALGICNHQWTEDEDNIMKEYYPIEGLQVINRLDKRTYQMIITRSNILKLNSIKWTEEEEELLKEYYPVEGRGVSLRLKNRSEGACADRARKLNITPPKEYLTYVKKWTTEEDEILKSVYPIKSTDILDGLFERHTKSACITRASLLGLSSGRRGRWEISNTELEQIKSIIVANHRLFNGDLTDVECMKLCNIGRKRFHDIKMKLLNKQ